MYRRCTCGRHVNFLFTHKTSLDSSSSVLPLCSAIEQFTLGLSHPKMTFRSLSCEDFLHCLRGLPSSLSHQSRQNLIIVEGTKRGGYRAPNNPDKVCSRIFSLIFYLAAQSIRKTRSCQWVDSSNVD